MIRVIVIGREQPLWVGLKLILGKESNLELIGLSPDDKEALLLKVQELKPAVIVVDENCCSADLSMIRNLQNMFPTLRVVAINTRENRLQIYDKKDVLIRDLGDFISAVQNTRIETKFDLFVPE